MHPFKAIGLKLISALLFAFMSALVRQLGDVAPVGQMVFFRSAFAILPVVLVYAVRGELATAVRTSRPLGQLGRGLLSVGGMFTNFSALTRLPLADATAISFASPLITVALAAIILKERVRIYRWSAVRDRICRRHRDADPAPRHRPLRGDRRRGCGGRLDVCRHLGLLQRGNGHPDATADAERNDIIDRVLFLTGLRHCRRADPAVCLAFADAARA